MISNHILNKSSYFKYKSVELDFKSKLNIISIFCKDL